MARIQGLIPPSSSRFADTYDVYVDYGKGRPVKIDDNEATFIDVEKFLRGKIDQSKMIQINNKFDKIIEINIANANKAKIRNNYAGELTESSEKSLTHKIDRHSSFRQNSRENTNSVYSHKDRSTFTPNPLNRGLLSFRLAPKLTHDETWLSNKQYNTRVTAFIDDINDEYNNRNERRTLRSCKYPLSSGQNIHERRYPEKIERKLCLHVAVNGASKSMRGQLPISNINLSHGDFGDDAGMVLESREFCFAGLADSAGGNRSLGINPADFSQAILAACRNILRQNTLQTNQLPRLVISAMQQVETSHIRGSSTLCLLALDKQEHTLASLNMGDSGFVIYRNKELYRRSTCTMNSNGGGPRQLFALGDSLGIPCYINETELLHDCSMDTVKVEKGDIIILSSDGLWDVIRVDQLQKIIERNANKHLQDLADDLLYQAIDGYTINNRDDILIIVCRVDEQ